MSTEHDNLPLDPAARPVGRRRGARVLVWDGHRVLLMADRDPGVEGSGWWVTPGGGIDEGEDERTAAARELFEETGLQVRPEQLEGPVARRLVHHGYSDRIRVQDECFFLLRHEAYQVSTAGFTAGEQARMGGSGWFTLDELAGMTVWPAEVRRVVEHALGCDHPEGGGCLDLGEVEESTVPV